MAHATAKTIELASPKAALTPCILDAHPGQLQMLAELVQLLGYEAFPTSEPEEAWRPIRSGKCRWLLGSEQLHFALNRGKFPAT